MIHFFQLKVQRLIYNIKYRNIINIKYRNNKYDINIIKNKK